MLHAGAADPAVARAPRTGGTARGRGVAGRGVRRRRACKRSVPPRPSSAGRGWNATSVAVVEGRQARAAVREADERPSRRAPGSAQASGSAGTRSPLPRDAGRDELGRRQDVRGRERRRAASAQDAPARRAPGGWARDAVRGSPAVVPPTGFEPVISTLKGWRPRPLDDGGPEPAGRPAECTSQAPWVPLQIRLMITAAGERT